jgi:HPt (histidine-containing phosphotransfer) domain-containing protein
MSATPDGWDATLEALNAEYRSNLPQEISRVTELWARCESRMNGLEPLRELRACVHRLAGSAGTFGLPDVGDAAASADSFLSGYCERGTVPTGADRSSGDILIARLTEVARALQ